MVIKDTLLFVAGDILHGLVIHPQYDAVGNEGLPFPDAGSGARFQVSISK